MKEWRILLALLGSMLLLTSCANDSATDDAAYEPVFEEAACWFTLPDTQPVDCGYLIVPEDRSAPDSSDIRIAAAILRHPDGVPDGPVGRARYRLH